jgi:hypothetical protein
MARPYPAGGVSIAQSNQHAVGPLLLAACGLQQFSGHTFPECSRRHPYCFRQHHTPDLGPRRGGAEERTGPGGPLLCIRILSHEIANLGFTGYNAHANNVAVSILRDCS